MRKAKKILRTSAHNTYRPDNGSHNHLRHGLPHQPVWSYAKNGVVTHFERVAREIQLDRMAKQLVDDSVKAWYADEFGAPAQWKKIAEAEFILAQEKPTPHSWSAWIMLILAFVFLLGTCFLSLCTRVEAANGFTTPVDVHVLDRRGFHGDISGVLDLGMVEASPFDKVNPPVAFIYVWPHLPSTTETLIRRAQDALYVGFRNKIEERKRLQLQYDWEAFLRGCALLLMCIGGGITVVYGWPPKEKVVDKPLWVERPERWSDKGNRI